MVSIIESRRMLGTSLVKCLARINMQLGWSQGMIWVNSLAVNGKRASNQMGAQALGWGLFKSRRELQVTWSSPGHPDCLELGEGSRRQPMGRMQVQAPLTA